MCPIIQYPWQGSKKRLLTKQSLCGKLQGSTMAPRAGEADFCRREQMTAMTWLVLSQILACAVALYCAWQGPFVAFLVLCISAMLAGAARKKADREGLLRGRRMNIGRRCPADEVPVGTYEVDMVLGNDEAFLQDSGRGDGEKGLWVELPESIQREAGEGKKLRVTYVNGAHAYQVLPAVGTPPRGRRDL